MCERTYTEGVVARSDRATHNMYAKLTSDIVKHVSSCVLYAVIGCGRLIEG